MIIRIFKISTMEMWTLKNKKALVMFIRQEIGVRASADQTINRLIRYLPSENYHMVKQTERRQ
jgi:hypothetical protein